MHIDIMTLFPDVVGDMLCESILGRAQERGIIRIECHQIRDYTTNKQNQVDDYPYGGGRGCVMQAQPLHACWEHLCREAGRHVHTIYMSAQGKVFTQEDAKRLKDRYDRLILVCGHYEGVDERFIEECVDEEISIGDFVMTGGEIPAMAVTDAVCRLVPGVLPDAECFTEESHWDGLLEYPQYSRPEVWQGRRVPEMLLSGHHANIARWRRKQALIRTMQRRPDMFAKLELTSKQDLKLLKEIEEDQRRVIRPLTAYEFDEARGLVLDTFMKFEAPDYVPEGVETFRSFLSDDEQVRKLDFYGAFLDGKLGGVIAMRDKTHISLLFVRDRLHRSGLGRALIEYALGTVDAPEFTVNSSPFAVGFYHKLGFTDVRPEETRDGIRYTPMVLRRRNTEQP